MKLCNGAELLNETIHHVYHDVSSLRTCIAEEENVPHLLVNVQLCESTEVSVSRAPADIQHVCTYVMSCSPLTFHQSQWMNVFWPNYVCMYVCP